MRVGLSGAYMITDRLKLQADVAYLPYVKFDGTDNHVLRALITQESGIGTGLQLDGVLSYAVNDEFSVGVGARYWSMWTTAQTIAEVTGTPCPCQTLPAKTELYGVFAQASYQFGDALFQ